MSVDVIQPSSMQPHKRARESITLSDDGVSKCGELFVTNCADKWTFYCTYCQKATTDIGVFICHIRLEHLNEQQELQQIQQTAAALASNVSTLQNDLNLDRSSNCTPIECSLPSAELVTRNTEQQEPMESHIVKEEPTVVASGQEHFDYEPISTTVSKIVDIYALTQPPTKEMEDGISDKNTTATSDELDEEFVALTTKDHKTEQQQQQENMKIIQVFYRNDEAIKEQVSKVKNDGNNDQEEDTNDSATDINTESEDETNDYQTQLQREQQHNTEEASCSNSKKPKQRRKIKEDRDQLPHKCQICHLGFKSRQGVHFHISKIHDKNLHKKLPHKCEVCNRGFKTLQGLKYHKVTHENKVHFKCPVCPATQYKLNIFINHVLTHESVSCFPCQVCGKVYDSNSERKLHWESHAKERPFGCIICYRRFRKQQYLTHHLKAHNQYQCHFCPYEFNSAGTQRPPYVCNRCEQLPDLKQKVKHLRSLAEKSHVFESDEDIDFATLTKHIEEQTFALTTLQQENEEITKTIEVVCISDDNINEDANTDTCYSVSDDDDDADDNDDEVEVETNGTEFENIDDDDKASCSSSCKVKNFRCTHCGKCFTSDVDLHVHIGRNHYASKNPKLPLECHKCKKGFRSANGLKGHLKLHEGITYLQCPICSEQLKKNHFATHVQLHESDTCFPCQVCGKIHKSNAERLKHWETHAIDQPYGCNICYRRYKRQKYLIKHVKYHRTNNRKDRPIYRNLNHACAYCNRHFKTPKDLQHHVTETHAETSKNDEFPIKCPECRKGFKTASGLRVHLKLHGDNIYVKCPLCKVKFNEQDFATHVVLHEEAEHFPCQVCGQTHKTTEERLTHWQTHAADQPYGCDICYRRFKKLDLLSNHLKCHPSYSCHFCEQKFTTIATERPPYVCGKCNKLPNVEEQVKRLRSENAQHQPAPNTNEDSNTTENMEVITDSDFNTNDDDSDLEFINETETNSGISSHYTKATITSPNKADIKHYKCVHCQNIYTSKEAVTFHLAKIHCKYDYTIYRFKCVRCIKSFRSKSGLDMHQKTHDKTKQNQCSVCQYVDFRRSSFARHVQTHASESCFPCQDCGKIFTNKTERLVHWKAHANERPYVCEICHRRFLYKHFHKAHMKAHGLYYCHFCPQHFNSERTLQPPYVCGNCEKLPDIKSIVEHQRSLSSKKHVFESDEGE